jgi:exopolysaccharide biosynthesis WecB/TagA/CpsF family protein
MIAHAIAMDSVSHMRARRAPGKAAPIIRVTSRPFAAKYRIARVSVGGLPLAVLDRAQSAELMLRAALARRGTGTPPPVITSANGQVLALCARAPALRAQMLAFDLIHADGMPLVFASRLKGRMPLPDRVATTDLFHDVASRAQAIGASFYLLGASESVLEAAVRNMRRAYPQLRIAGYHHGYFSVSRERDIIAEINRVRPDILWVGMGVPAEQAFVLRNRDRLVGAGLIKTAGGLFDFLSGRNSRAPRWMQAAGLEWLYRTALEPRRLLYRYLSTNPYAVYLLLTRPVYVIPSGQDPQSG